MEKSQPRPRPNIDNTKPGGPLGAEPKKDPSFSVDGIFVVLGTETPGKNGGASYEAQVGFKIDNSGDPKKDWVRFSYVTFRKIIAGIQQNKEHFNTQLELEKAKISGLEAF
ncbi:MAG: hypothetical protein PHV30_09180 [Candidatus Margulisbacteria bacterium]|nr:hypothetical protein [Candidatus Margulisiibacteriota bacterium]